jgi:hypothetical protein
MGRMTQSDREYFGFEGELNIRFGIEYDHIVFSETPQPADNIAIFSTFEEAKAAAILSYGEYKNKMLIELEENEKILLTLTEDNVFGYNPDGGW